MFDLTTLIPTLLTIAVTVLLTTVPVYVGIMSRLSSMETKLEVLTKSVEKHNGFAERMPAMEQQITDIKRDLDDIFNRLRKLELRGKHE